MSDKIEKLQIKYIDIEEGLFKKKNETLKFIDTVEMFNKINELVDAVNEMRNK